MKKTLALVALLLAASAPAARAGPGDVSPDSIYMVGEFVDPVCIFQHGMLGTAQRECAMVRGRVEQGMYFYDIRRRRLYTVIGQNHWEDPKQGFLDALGDTFAIRARVWKFAGSQAIAVTAVYPPDRQPAPQAKLWPWHWEWTVLAGCGILALLYLLALGPWRGRLGGAGLPYERGRAAMFLCGLVVVVLSLDGPIHDLSDQYLFWTHMVQHLLLAQVFPLLFLLGLPPWLRQALLRPRAAGAAWSFVAGVPVGFALYTVVFSIWHVPLLYNLMMRDHSFHVVMHLMVMVTATMMWWPVAGGEAVRRPLSPGGQMLYLFLLGTPMMAVAAMIVFAGRPLYEWYALAPRLWGMSAVDDQRLGGLIMWIPGGMFYWGVMSVVYFRWAGREREPETPLVHGTA
ncbi:MAG: cytochrome c oxidase assembly protein [Candidatus Eisenbacteria bacterium]|nr:cytochrome c oxidase assembly protein [Candidatus Eisenbacteria bacterium]